MESDDFYSRQADRILSKLTDSLDRRFLAVIQNETEGVNLVLYTLYFRPDRQSVTGISETINVSPARVTRILDNLEEKAYVRRYHDKSDHRVVYAGLTETGHQYVEDKIALIKDHLVHMLKDLGPEDVENLVRIYNKIRCYHKETAKEGV